MNSEWLSKMNFEDIIKLASKYTVARIMERDDFKHRFENKLPLSMHELLYPLMQGYDSVVLNADIEIGGTDQTIEIKNEVVIQFEKNKRLFIENKILEIVFYYIYIELYQYKYRHNDKHIRYNEKRYSIDKKLLR